MSTAIRLLTIAPPAPAARHRYGLRAPVGGCTVNGKLYKGGQFAPAYDPANPHGLALAAPAPAPAFDVTREDLEVTIANPATGGARTFRIETVFSGPLAGKRVASVLVGSDPWSPSSWDGFAFVDDFGLTPWRRFSTAREVVGKSGYVALLTESSRFSDRLEYVVSR